MDDELYSQEKNKKKESAHVCEIVKTEGEWKAELTPEQFRVLIKKGTEMPFSGKYVDSKKRGRYVCAACNEYLFDSSTKFDSGTGWPSFWQVASSDRVSLVEDRSHGMLRTEVACKKCGGHLGHVFNDGPKPTGLRFCINSVSLNFVPESSTK
ncbi:hypothetical protein CHS0354_000755 [Potamilus streckersoni]|uniref:Peptide-methionine (R)-S-oxide reductase n=1 Tax=Potamilus streckersoni TaxID=2493646 RepID=A0AAE0T7W9_9BIVA|nr:hypothetical protein CHS0354_000755 [Potamilus streckersoni]